MAFFKKPEPYLFTDAVTGGAGGPVPPPIFADQLTLFQLRLEDSAHPLLPATPQFFFSDIFLFLTSLQKKVCTSLFDTE